MTLLIKWNPLESGTIDGDSPVHVPLTDLAVS